MSNKICKYYKICPHYRKSSNACNDERYRFRDMDPYCGIYRRFQNEDPELLQSIKMISHDESDRVDAKINNSHSIKHKCEYIEYCPLYHTNKEKKTICETFGGPFCGTWLRFQELTTEKQKTFYRTKSLFYGLHKLITAFIRKHPQFILPMDLTPEPESYNNIEIRFIPFNPKHSMRNIDPSFLKKIVKILEKASKKFHDPILKAFLKKLKQDQEGLE